MSTPREQVGAQILADNPAYLVNTYPSEPEQVTARHPYVNVYCSSIAPAEDDRLLEHTLEVHVYASKVAGDAAEAEVETIRDQVLLSVQRLTDYKWTRAERVTFTPDAGGSFVGYKITVLGGSHNEYAATIRNEIQA